LRLLRTTKDINNSQFSFFMKKIPLLLVLGLATSGAYAQNSRQLEDARRDSIAQASALRNLISQQNNQAAPATSSPGPQTTPPLSPPASNGTRYPDEYNVSGKNDLIYIDNNGQQAHAKINTPSATENPIWSIALRHKQPTGQFVDWFTYRGENGSNYETRVVTTSSNDPDKRIEVHFESRKVGGEEFKKSRVVVIDWDGSPWLVKVEFSNEKGVYFKFSPFQPEPK